MWNCLYLNFSIKRFSPFGNCKKVVREKELFVNSYIYEGFFTTGKDCCINTDYRGFFTTGKDF